MAVNLSELVTTLKREVTAPGAEDTTFPDATDDTWLGHLRDAFWDVRLDGMLSGYVETEGTVVTTNGGADLSRDLQQLIVLYAGIRIVRNHLRSINTQFRAQAGPVEYEVQQSAQVLSRLLDELQKRRSVVLGRLSDMGIIEDYYIDAVVERDWGIRTGGGDFGPVWVGS